MIHLFYLKFLFALMNSTNCYEVKSQEWLMNELDKNEIQFGYHGTQLFESSRLAVIYKLKNEKIILLPESIYENGKGLILNNYDCLAQMLVEDYIPIENPEKTYLESNQDQLHRLHEDVDYFLKYLNNRFGSDFVDIDKSSYEFFYSKILANYTNQDNEDEDYLALTILAGELIRKSREGKWILIKNEGVFNPYYEPSILLKDNSIVDFSFASLNRLSNRIEFSDLYFNSLLNVPAYLNIQILKENGEAYKILD